MPNLIQRELAEDSKQIVAEIGHTVTWQETDYPAIASDPDITAELSEGGFMPEGDFRIKIRREEFNNGAGPYPKINDRVTFDGDVYRVIAERNKGQSAFVILMIET